LQNSSAHVGIIDTTTGEQRGWTAKEKKRPDFRSKLGRSLGALGEGREEKNAWPQNGVPRHKIGGGKKRERENEGISRSRGKAILGVGELEIRAISCVRIQKGFEGRKKEIGKPKEGRMVDVWEAADGEKARGGDHGTTPNDAKRSATIGIVLCARGGVGSASDDRAAKESGKKSEIIIWEEGNWVFVTILGAEKP